MREYIVENDFIIDGFRCVIIGHSLGHRCGYIGIPKDHKLYGVNYFDIDINIHGGLTYSECSNEVYPIAAKDIWWIGFDCGHYDDKKDIELIKLFNEDKEFINLMLQMERKFPDHGEVGTKEYVKKELILGVNQIKELYN